MNNEDERASNGDRLHDEFRAEILKCQLSNSQILDKSILSLSSAALGFSLIFIKTLLPSTDVTCLCLLYFSWGTLILAIISTLLSFPIGQKALDVQLEIDYQYHILDDDDAIKKQNVWNQITAWLSGCSISFYILGISFAIFFFASNMKFGTE